LRDGYVEGKVDGFCDCVTVGVFDGEKVGNENGAPLFRKIDDGGDAESNVGGSVVGGAVPFTRVTAIAFCNPSSLRFEAT